MNIDKLNEEARYIRISIPYYKEDGLINFDDGLMTELECEDDFTPPMLDEDTLLLEYVIDLKMCKVVNYKCEEGYLRMWAKVRDSGTYTLLDSDKHPLWQICGHVPSKLIPPFEKGWGDYIELAVNGDGTVIDWPKIPDFSDFIKNGQEPKPVETNRWYRAKSALSSVHSKRLDKEETLWLIEELKKDL